MRGIVWIFPILFIFHDFEEIIMMKAWISRNDTNLQDRFPKIANKILPHFHKISTSSFAIGVYEEFLLVCVLIIASLATNQYELWFGCFMAFTIHLIIHCFQAILMKGYVPCLATSLICLPFCLYIIKFSLAILQFNFRTVILYSVLSFTMLVINLAVLHKVMTTFDKWLIKFENK